MNDLRLTIFLIGLLGIVNCPGQDLFTGRVLDARKGFPLISATVYLSVRGVGVYTDHEGRFTLDVAGAAPTDTLVISYIGYEPFRTLLQTARPDSLFPLKEAAMILKEITVLGRTPEKPDIKKLESSLRIIHGKLYATNIEVTNCDYNRFLRYLLQTGDEALYQQYKPDVSIHEGSLLAFFKAYHAAATNGEKATPAEYDNYPVVNITHEAAIAYCAWLTQQYSETKGKRKFKQVVFRLPALKEWQITALGYPKFQSWTLDDNEIETFISNDPNEMVGKIKKTIPFKGSDIRYPWFNAYDYRNKPQNHKHCWLGNFNVPKDAVSCLIYRPDGDGYAITGKCGSYFPNDMGFYDVVGNVAEMIDEKGTACGGSWNHAPEDATITSVVQYRRSSMMVGFRVFMEVLE